MFTKKIYYFLVFFCLQIGVFFAQSDLLKYKDIDRVMSQIFQQHVSQREMSKEILKKSLKIYIDQFDPERIYLLEEEVTPYLQLDDRQMSLIMKEYKNQNFTSFIKLNTVIQKAILRARDYRKKIAQNTELWKKAKIGPIINYGSESRVSFAKDEADLEQRIQQNIAKFAELKNRRLSNGQYSYSPQQILNLYEQELLPKEDAYLGVDRKGNALPQEKKENLFILHILKALAGSLDAHTSFFDPSEAYDMRVRLEKNFPGLGIILQKVEGGVSIKKMIEGGPAQKSGLVRVNDEIIAIDNQKIDSLDFDTITEMLRGPLGSQVSLTIKRNNQDPIQIKLARETIVINEDRIDSSYETYGNGIIGKITLHSFYKGDNGISSERDLKKTIASLKKIGPLKGLILDLRDNSGGFLTQAVKVVGLFITNGVVVISKYNNGQMHVYRDMDSLKVFDGPLIVLTSRATASAAEIVAQALQDYGVAIIVGDEQTYGKGTIQSQTVTDDAGTSYFKVTVGKYYTVSGKTPQIQGVKADIVVPTEFSQEHIGEGYLDYTLKTDTIPDGYQDKLEDIDPKLRGWYMRYYLPTLQAKIDKWRELLPILKKSSQKRISENKNFQTFLKVLKKEKITKDEAQALRKSLKSTDLQMDEATNILKDIIRYNQKNRNESLLLENATR